MDDAKRGIGFKSFQILELIGQGTFGKVFKVGVRERLRRAGEEAQRAAGVRDEDAEQELPREAAVAQVRSGRVQHLEAHLAPIHPQTTLCVSGTIVCRGAGVDV